MKHYLTKTLALVLAFVLVLGAVPFAMAAEIYIYCGQDAVWPGETVTLTVKGIEDEAKLGTTWSDGSKGTTTSYSVPENATGSVTVKATVMLGDSMTDYETHTPTITLPIKTPATGISISADATTVEAGEPVNFDYTVSPADNDATVSWTGGVNKSGVFRTDEPGTYKVTATANNGGKFDDVTSNEVTITVTEKEEGDYTVELENCTVPLSGSGKTMDYTVRDADGKTPENYTREFSVVSGGDYIQIGAETGKVTPLAAGTATVRLAITVDGVVYTDTASVTVTDKGLITCAQDMTETSSGSLSMRFVLDGADRSDVDWTVTVSEGFEVDNLTENGSYATADIVPEDIGVATVKATASWGSNSASGTFYVSFYQKASYTVTLEDNVKEFAFDDTGVFSKVEGASNAARTSLYSLLTDGAGTRVILTENRSANSRVGKITVDTKSGFYQYDPDDENEYNTGSLDDLTFEVLGQGTYELDYEIYATAGGAGLTTSKGSITINVGDVGSDIEYSTVTGGSVSFKVKDFEDFWEEYAEDEKEDLNYVVFDVATSSDLTGIMKNGSDLIKANQKFYVDYDEDKKNTYDLSKVSYVAAESGKDYVDYIGFTCYGEEGETITGTVAVTVGSGKMSFTDVSKDDWFYDEVYYVYTRNIMNGIGTNEFAPNNTLNRAMVVTMLYRLQGQPATSTSGTFTDVPTGQWYTEAVEWAAKNSIVNGMGDGKFAPESPITREQLAAILYRYAKYDGKDVSVGEDTNILSYDDATSISEYAVSALQWACGEGIITGDGGKLMPQGSATRAQAAAMFARFMENATEVEDEDDEDKDDGNTIVYVVGKKYHMDEDCAGKNATEKKLKKVEDTYTPCSKCVD